MIKSEYINKKIPAVQNLNWNIQHTIKALFSFVSSGSSFFKITKSEKDGIIHNINIQAFASQGTYIDKALEHVIDEFANVSHHLYKC